MQQLKLKLLELGKTRTKKVSLDLFNIYEDLAGHDKVNNAATFTTCRRKIKPMLTNKSIEKEGPFENKGFNRKTV